MKLWRSCLIVVCIVLPIMINANKISPESELWEELDNNNRDDKEILVRTIRGTKERGVGGSSSSSSSNSPSCQYNKDQWSECDSKTNIKTRTLTLKKGDKNCEQTKTVSKKCKACRYEKGTWSSCVDNNMQRIDNLKPSSSESKCEKTRLVNKSCKSEANSKKNKKDRSKKKANKQQ